MKEMKEMKEKVTSYEDVERFILDQINEVHMYRMCYFKELRSEEDWGHYLNDNMQDGYKLLHKACEKYLFSGCPQEFTNDVITWYNSSREMLEDFRRLLYINYDKKYIRSTIKAFTIAYKKIYKEL